MEADDRRAAVLLPGLLLPDEFVLTHIITRLPWHTRPVCRAVSKAWRATIDSSIGRPDLTLKSRHHFLPSLRGRFLFITFDYHIFISENLHEGRRTGYHCMPWRESTYQICKHWRQLPSPRDFLPPAPDYVSLIANSGMVYAWPNRQRRFFVLKMDMAGGDWHWSMISVSYPFDYHTVAYNAKIYVPRVWTLTKSPWTGRHAVLVHDMVKEDCELIKAWKRDSLRVLSPKMLGASLQGSEQELYRIVQRRLSSGIELQILGHDAREDSWWNVDCMPVPKWADAADIELFNGDCFRPKQDLNINIVFADSKAKLLIWRKNSPREKWASFRFNGNLMNKSLEHLRFIDGQPYGLFIEKKDSVDSESAKNAEVDREKQQDPRLYKRTIMKGTMVVRRKKIHWEEVLDVGCFKEVYFIMPSVVPPVEFYTVMT